MQDIVVITLPRPAGCPLLHTKSKKLRGKMCSVRLDRSGRMDELAALLETQRPRVLVVSALHRMTGRDVQRVTDLAFRYCPNVSIVGAFASTNWGETFTVRISGAVRTFCLMDSEDTMRGNDIIVYGAVDRLDMLSISSDCRVHVSGMMAPSINACIRARQLTINGHRAPVTSQPVGNPPTYMFKTVPPVMMPPVMPAQPAFPQPLEPQPLQHPQPRRALSPAVLNSLNCAVPVCG